MRTMWFFFGWFLVAIILLWAACGGNEGDDNHAKCVAYAEIITIDNQDLVGVVDICKDGSYVINLEIDPGNAEFKIVKPMKEGHDGSR